MLLQDGFMRSAFSLPSWEKPTHCSGRCLRSLPVTGHGERPRSLCMRCLSKVTMVPFLGVNVGLSLNCHIPPSVLVANSRLEPRFWAGMLWMWSRTAPFECSLFMWKYSQVFILLSFQRLPLLLPASAQLRWQLARRSRHPERC